MQSPARPNALAASDADVHKLDPIFAPKCGPWKEYALISLNSAGRGIPSTTGGFVDFEPCTELEGDGNAVEFATLSNSTAAAADRDSADAEDAEEEEEEEEEEEIDRDESSARCKEPTSPADSRLGPPLSGRGALVSATAMLAIEWTAYFK